jgi:hypothetical protein
LFVTSILPKDGLLLLFKNDRGGFPQGPFFNDLLGQPLHHLFNNAAWPVMDM